MLICISEALFSPIGRLVRAYQWSRDQPLEAQAAVLPLPHLLLPLLMMLPMIQVSAAAVPLLLQLPLLGWSCYRRVLL